MPVAWVRKEMTVFGERVWKELNGYSCLDLDQVAIRKNRYALADHLVLL